MNPSRVVSPRLSAARTVYNRRAMNCSKKQSAQSYSRRSRMSPDECQGGRIRRPAQATERRGLRVMAVAYIDGHPVVVELIIDEREGA